MNIARETSKWLLECEPQVSPKSEQSWATRTEPRIVQKCGSASGMSTALDRMAWAICRQSVAIMLVAVCRPVARRNSAIVPAREPALGADRVLGVGEDVAQILDSSTASASSQPPFGSRVTRASGKRAARACTAATSCSPGSTPPLSLKSVNPYRAWAASASATTASGVMACSRRSCSQSSAGSLSARYGRSVAAVADVEEVAQHRHAVALLPVAEQLRDRHPEVLAEQVEQRRFQRGDRVDRGPQVEGLQPAAAGVAVGEGGRDLAQQAAVGAIGCPASSAPASSMVRRIASPPGTSPTPTLPRCR